MRFQELEKGRPVFLDDAMDAGAHPERNVRFRTPVVEPVLPKAFAAEKCRPVQEKGKGRRFASPSQLVMRIFNISP
jgi:hypothetical protein